MQIDFNTALACMGGLLVFAAVASGLSGRSVLSVSVLATLAGVVLAATGLIEIDPRAGIVVGIVEVVLLVTLFSDGLLVEEAIVRRLWRAPARALVVAMPVNATLLALAAKGLFGELTWAEAFLLGFVLSPTDPVLTSSVVSSEEVPADVRQTLNLESGLNDGLALPFVLFFLAVTTGEAGGLADAAGDLALESVVGLLIGGALALAAGRLLDALPEWAITRRYEGLYALGLGVGAYGMAELLHGNGFIAAFVAGMGLAVTRTELPEVFHRFNEDLGAILQLAAFVLFGALLVVTGFDVPIVALAAFVVFALVVARPISVVLAFLGIEMRLAEKAFIAWFGPKGIASMLFALFVLNSSAADRSLVFDVAATTILASVLAHGLTDTVGARWIGAHLGTARAPTAAAPAPHGPATADPP